jgi:hypothetical protein
MAMTDRDRLAGIKARLKYDPALSDHYDVFWLIAELEAAWERLGKIEEDEGECP